MIYWLLYQEYFKSETIIMLSVFGIHKYCCSVLISILNWLVTFFILYHPTWWLIFKNCNRMFGCFVSWVKWACCCTRSCDVGFDNLDKKIELVYKDLLLLVMILLSWGGEFIQITFLFFSVSLWGSIVKKKL